jgi:hypothetical protein|nr:hypothetical protein [Kofleriaceae bacterium]
MPPVFLDGIARAVVLVHAIAALVLVGAATHHAVVAIGLVRGAVRLRLARIYAATVAIAWTASFALGLLAYPAFRVGVRAGYLDAAEPWASNLFDIKEHVAALGLPLVLGVFALSRRLEPRTDRALAGGYAALVVLAAALAWIDVIAGLLVTMARGV